MDASHIEKEQKSIICNNCVFGSLHITCSNMVIISNGVVIGRFVHNTDNSHGKTYGSEMYTAPEYREVYYKCPIMIGDNVGIGEKVSIMPNVTIGEGTTNASNSVVTHNVPTFYICRLFCYC